MIWAAEARKPHAAALDLQRLLDVLVAATALLLLAPFLPFLMLAIRLDSPGPVIFGQERLGLDQCPFRCLKLRTMHHGADSSTWTTAGDPRVTRVGRWLRRMHLDEVPQLWNVLRGEMAIVGPRPIRYEAARSLGVLEHPRWTVRPGITGWAQIKNGSPVTAEEQLAKFEVDAEYVARRSLRVDLMIMLLTFGILIRLRGL